AMRGKTVEYDRFRIGLLEDSRVQLIPGKRLKAGRGLALLAHAREDVCGEHMGSACGLERIFMEDDLCSLGTSRLYETTPGREALGAGEVQRATQDADGFEPRIGHIIAVADPGELEPAQGPEVSARGLEISAELHGVTLVGERIEDRDLHVPNHLFESTLIVGTEGDAMDHSTEDTRGVTDRLAPSHLRSRLR